MVIVVVVVVVVVVVAWRAASSSSRNSAFFFCEYFLAAISGVLQLGLPLLVSVCGLWGMFWCLVLFRSSRAVCRCRRSARWRAPFSFFLRVYSFLYLAPSISSFFFSVLNITRGGGRIFMHMHAPCTASHSRQQRPWVMGKQHE